MPINGKPTYYEFFGLENFDNNYERIKKAYRSMALKWHPDRVADSEKINAERMMKQVNEIWVVLSTKKESYDSYLRRKIGGSGEDYQGQTSADAWSTAGTWSFDFSNMEEMLRKARAESYGNNFFATAKKKKIDEISKTLMQLSNEDIDQIEKFIFFVRGR